jgi:hypothetical protein
MDRITDIRGKIITALAGLKYSNTSIPVFDEVVNPSVAIPSVGGASAVYVVIQDQTEQYNPVQTVCAPRFDINTTIRVVTKWKSTGSMKLSEDIGETILGLLRNSRGATTLTGVKKVDLVMSRSIAEYTEKELSFSKVIILKFIKNG